MEGLTPGRIVHYVMPNGQNRPAIVTHVWNQEGCVNLTVFTDWLNDEIGTHNGLYWATSVLFNSQSIYNPETMRNEYQPQTWHWIERV